AASTAGPRSSWRTAPSFALHSALFDARQEFALPDLDRHGRTELVDDDAVRIDEKRFGRAVCTEVDADVTLRVECRDDIRIAERLQPVLRPPRLTPPITSAP